MAICPATLPRTGKSSWGAIASHSATAPTQGSIFLLWPGIRDITLRNSQEEKKRCKEIIIKQCKFLYDIYDVQSGHSRGRETFVVGHWCHRRPSREVNLQIKDKMDRRQSGGERFRQKAQDSLK